MPKEMYISNEVGLVLQWTKSPWRNDQHKVLLLWLHNYDVNPNELDNATCFAVKAA